MESKGKENDNRKQLLPGTVITHTKGRLYQVKLLGKVLQGGRESLYLSHYRGKGQKSDIEYLNLIIKINPKTPEDRAYNKEQLDLALSIREKRESMLKHQAEGLISPKLKRINFLDYAQAYLDKYPNKDIRLLRNCLVKFREYIQKDFILPGEIHEDLVKGFKKYLLNNLNGETPSNYFSKFKRLCKQATKDRILELNPCEEISMPKDSSIRKAILDYEEIQMLAATPCRRPEVKKAFLFACNTALGFSELKALKWGSIDLKAKKMTIQRNKVKTTSNKSINHLDLNANTIKLLGPPGNADEPVFKLHTYKCHLSFCKAYCSHTSFSWGN
jgi:integrase/recombinase XerD